MSVIDLTMLPAKEVIAGYNGRSFHTGTSTFMYWTVEAGAIMPVHSHVHQQVAQVLKGEFALTVDENTILLQPGMAIVIAPHVRHGGKAITACELLDVFTPERDDYKFL